ncbi:MAG: preprotein translocase subunit YajC [Candidatus Marinimicrobia bacterium]|nr:preprotein translocase subunit YajC [Candidatus Neomarinimicrobiota bacterium]MDP6852375.1 preprotein translocase subunit YajC [Candidatus Neomarinimicrobiota bacterium]
MDILLAQSGTGAPAGSGLAAFLPFILIGIVFYFLILRPQTKQRKNHESVIASLKKGDKILTRGGLYGKIVNFQGKNDNKIVIDAGSGVKLSVARSYIAGLANNNDVTSESK